MRRGPVVVGGLGNAKGGEDRSGVELKLVSHLKFAGSLEKRRRFDDGKDLLLLDYLGYMTGVAYWREVESAS